MLVGLKRDRDVIHKTQVQMNNWAKQKERERLHYYFFLMIYLLLKQTDLQKLEDWGYNINLLHWKNT